MYEFAVIIIGTAKNTKTVRFNINVTEGYSNGKLFIANIQCMLPCFYAAESACVNNQCDHVRARIWVQCCCCEQWYHCVCVGAAYSDVKKDNYVFTCSNC